MKHKRLLIHLLSIGVLAAGLGLSILIQPEPGGYLSFSNAMALTPAAEPQIILADFGSSSIPPFSCSPSILNLYMLTKNSICNSKPGRLL